MRPPRPKSPVRSISKLGSRTRELKRRTAPAAALDWAATELEESQSIPDDEQTPLDFAGVGIGSSNFDIYSNTFSGVYDLTPTTTQGIWVHQAGIYWAAAVVTWEPGSYTKHSLFVTAVSEEPWGALGHLQGSTMVGIGDGAGGSPQWSSIGGDAASAAPHIYETSADAGMYSPQNPLYTGSNTTHRQQGVFAITDYDVSNDDGYRPLFGVWAHHTAGSAKDVTACRLYIVRLGSLPAQVEP